VVAAKPAAVVVAKPVAVAHRKAAADMPVPAEHRVAVAAGNTSNL
jgi:hypothetical protein